MDIGFQANLPIIMTETSRLSTKRRCASPRLFPRKVHITEEKVAQELESLCISANPNTLKPQADFLVDGTQRLKTFEELEESIEIDEEQLNGAVELAPELISEIRKLSRRILTAQSYRHNTKSLPSPCQELVLWKPPSGVISDILQAVKVHSNDLNKKNSEQTQHKLNCIEETDSEMDFTMLMNENFSSTHIAPTININYDNRTVDREMMDINMEL